MGLSARALERWMDEHTACGPGPVTDAAVLAGGTQDTLIRFAKGGRCYVLRMAAGGRESRAYPWLNREAQILSALARSDVPHPHVVGVEDGHAGTDGVRVTGIAPGFVDTRLTQRTIGNAEAYKHSWRSIPLRRWGTSAEMGGVAVFLASSQASYLTGHMVIADRGRTLR